MDTENNAMHVNSKHKWCMKKNFGQKLRNWKFFSFDQSCIDWIPIEWGWEQWLKIKGFSIGRKTHSIDRNSGNLNFLKNCRRLCGNNSTQVISWMKCMWMSLNVFQKHEFSTQNFKTKIFNHQKHNFCQPLTIFCIKLHRKQSWMATLVHTQFHVLSLAKNNLWSVCN